LKSFYARMNDHSENLAQILGREVGKPIKLARLEVQRALSTIEWTMIEAPEVFSKKGLPTSSRSTWQGLEGWSVYEGRGPLLAITPFNFPVNLAIHKIAPAIAAGCPVILKPSPRAALTALLIADHMHAAGLPAGMLSVIQCEDALVRFLCDDSRVAQVSFTGSAHVGWELARGLTKPIELELGGTAPAFVSAHSNVESAARKLLTGAFSYAGQVCISVQNLAVESKAYGDFRAALGAETAKFPWGHPSHEDVLSSSVINSEAARRLLVARDSLLASGGRVAFEAAEPKGMTPTDLAANAAFVRPTVFEFTPRSHALYTQEAFGPFLNLEQEEDLDDWISRVNAYPGRLQACVFTDRLDEAYKAASKLRYGGVIINESAALRIDPMPYGGRGLSGRGREGPRHAMESYCELKSVILRP
jgi:acyl-CoA reductase-like NAD-dependent aldehyde dehydrogenase